MAQDITKKITEGNYTDILDMIMEEPYHDQVMDHMVGYVADIAFWLAIGAGMIGFLWDVISNVVNKFTTEANPNFFSAKVLIEIISKLVLIGIFTASVPLFLNGVDWFNDLFAMGPVQQAQMQKEAAERKEKAIFTMEDLEEKAMGAVEQSKNATAMEKEFAQREQGVQPQTQQESEDRGLLKSLKRLLWLLSPANLFSMTLSVASFIISGLIRFIIMIVALYMFKFMLILGPLAIATSNLPIFKDKIGAWFAFTINMGLLQTTVNLLDHYMFAYFYGKVTHYGINIYADIGFNIAIIVMFLSLFKLTSKFAGSAEGGQMVGKAVMLTTIAVAGGVAAGLGAFAQGSKMSNMMNNVVSSLREGFRDA